MQIANGTTDVTTYFVLRDATTHAPKTDVTITDIDLYYVEQGAAISAKADATALAAADSAHTDSYAFHVGQGLYRIDWPDTCFNGGVGKVVNLIVVCTGVDTTFLEVELTGVAQTGDAYARLGAPAGASVSADIADLPTVAEFEARTLPSASYFDPATDTVANVTLASTQGAVTFGQVKIVANVAGQGALDVLNQHANGIGTHNAAGLVGQRNVGGSGIGLENVSSAGVGQRNAGPLGGQVNLGSSEGPGQSNEGSIGQYNNGTTTVGQRNEGAETGQYNYGATAYGVSTVGDTAAYDPALPTVTELNARTLPSASYFDPAADTVANVTTVGSVTGAVGSVTGAVGSVTGAVGSVTGNVGGNVTGSVGSVVAAVTAGTVSDKTGYALTSAYDAAKTAATQTSVNAIDDYVDSEVGAIKAVTDKLDTALELDGAVYRYTTNALEQSPGTSGDSAGVTELLTRIPDASPGAIGGLPLSKDASGRVEVASATDKNTLDSVITAIQGADGDTLKDLSDEIALVGGGGGAGTGTYTDTVTDGTNPLDGVRVQLSTDSAKTNPVYQAYTNALGVFLMHPDPGAYYVWFEKAGYDFSAVNGTGVTVT